MSRSLFKSFGIQFEFYLSFSSDFRVIMFLVFVSFFWSSLINLASYCDRFDFQTQAQLELMKTFEASVNDHVARQ